MNDENEINLNAVFKNCNNDFKSFLLVIANYLVKKPSFTEYNIQNVSKLFENETENSSTAAHGTTLVAPNGESVALLLPETQMNGDDSRDIFDNVNNDESEVVIPETQHFNDESNDSGESVVIPLFNKKNENCLFRLSSNESDDDSEFDPVRPDSAASDHSDQQSQMLMANLDQRFLRVFGDSIGANENTDPAQATINNNLAQNDAENNVSNGCVDRSESTTPDLGITISMGNVTDAEQPQPQPQNADDLDETQMFSENIFDACTQYLNQPSTPDQTSSDDELFLAATQVPEFIHPAAVNSVKNEQSKIVEAADDDIFDVATQIPPEHDIFDVDTQIVEIGANNNGSTSSANDQRNKTNEEAEDEDEIFGAATQIVHEHVFLHPAPAIQLRSKVGQNKKIIETNDGNEEIFDAATQQAPAILSIKSLPKSVNQSRSEAIEISKTIPEADEDDNDDIFGAATQKASEQDIYDVATQVMPSDKPMKKHVTWVTNDNRQKSNDHNTSDDLFDEEIQESTISNEHDQNEMNSFDMPTQPMNDHDIDAMRKQRFSAVITQSSQPANTPEWSLAARITNAQIDQFEHELAQREKKRENLKKQRYLFSSDEEDNDDLEFDLPKPVSPKMNTSSNRSSIDKMKRSANDDNEPLAKKPSKHIDLLASITKRRVSISLSQTEVNKYLQKEANNPKTSRQAAKPTETKAKPIESRSLRTRKSPSNRDASNNMTESRQNKRKMTQEPEQPKQKRQKESEKPEKNAIKPESKTRGGKNRPSNESENIPKTKTVVVTTENSPPTVNTHLNRHTSDRPSTRKSSKLAILFTKVNPIPYMSTIQNLGGCIVDTPQLGNVLICDKISSTFKFLYAISKGIPIVSSHWLDVSAEQNEFQSLDNYLVIDKNVEKRFNFNLRKSLEAARQTKLFANYHIFATPNVQPITSEISDIVECSGGKYSDNPSKRRKPNTIAVLISHKKDNKLWNIYRDAHPDIQIVSSEGFMQSVVQQKINFFDYIIK